MHRHLTATAFNPTFTEDGSAVALFINTNASTIEAGQTIKALSFTVSNISDGASEQVILDGSTIALVNGSGITTTNGMNYTVSVVRGGTATISLSSTAGVSVANIDNLINNINYQDTSITPTAGTRTFTLAQIQDSGGTAHGGSDTTALAISSIVNIVAFNNAPTLTATGTNPTFQEAAGYETQAAAVAVFSSTNTNTIESGQTITGLTFTVSGLG